MKTLAKITELDEAILDSPQLYNTVRYFYPLISYQYEVNGKQMTGKISKKNSREYRVKEYDAFGTKNEQSQFFWRQLSEGDKLDIFYNKKQTHKSYLMNGRTSVYKSETTALFIISLIFGLLFIISIFYLWGKNL